MCIECCGWFGWCFVFGRIGLYYVLVGVGGGDLFDILICCEIYVLSFLYELVVFDFEVEF